MNRISIIYEGAGDEPLGELDGRTPLQAARSHHAAALAGGGRCGVLEPWASETPWRPEWLLGAMCGIPAAEIGGLHRGPLEALGAGIEPGEAETVYRGDFVTMDGTVIRDNLSGRLGDEETAGLAAVVDAASGEDCDVVAVGAGSVSVRFRGMDARGTPGTPAGAAAGDNVADAVAGGAVSERMQAVMRVAADVLPGQPINEVRVDLGENPANGLWLWGGGTWPRGAERPEREGPEADVMATTSLLARGMARLCGFGVLAWPEPWRDDAEPMHFPMPDVVRVLREHERVIIFVQTPLDGGRFPSAVAKVRALDRLDQELLGPLMNILEAYRPFRLALIAGGVISSRSGAAISHPAPVVLAGDGLEPDAVERWDEETCAGGGLGSMNAGDFLRRIEDR